MAQSTLSLEGVQYSSRHLPQRYQEDFQEAFYSRVREDFRSGMAILDVGSGRLPTIARPDRPTDCRYVGLDVSESELNLAADSYNEHCVSDIVQFQSELEGQFDLAVSWQVLEHVKPQQSALENIRRYLKPGGRFVGHLSGRYAFFGLMNQVLPPSLPPRLLRTFLHRDPETVFPAYYDAAWQSRLEALLTDWSSAVVVPRFNGAVYLRWFKPAQYLYLLYENWALEKGHHNLATHYLIDARR